MFQRQIQFTITAPQASAKASQTASASAQEIATQDVWGSSASAIAETRKKLPPCMKKENGAFSRLAKRNAISAIREAIARVESTAVSEKRDSKEGVKSPSCAATKEIPRFCRFLRHLKSRRREKFSDSSVLYISTPRKEPRYEVTKQFLL